MPAPGTAKPDQKKYVVVLAHADGWGALSANKVVKDIHKRYPDVGIFLVVSQASKNKEGKILTKLGDLELPRELKETNMLEYFRRIDEKFDTTPTQEQLDELAKKPMDEGDRTLAFFEAGKRQGELTRAQLLTFKQLAKQCCADGQVHYTTRGGPKGGEEVEAVFKKLETEQGIIPEVVLSVDTMAILPASITGRFHCFSTHPGPLDTIKVEGMQGTLRSLVEQVLYDKDGEPLPADYQLGMPGQPAAHLKGTLFMQHPELDKGPPITSTLSVICPGVCAYMSRDMVYDALTTEMLKRLPQFLDSGDRQKLVDEANAAKAETDKLPHRRVPELDPDKFATWQGQSVGIPVSDGRGRRRLEVIQNSIVDPGYFKNTMQLFYPGNEAEFSKQFDEVYGKTIQRLEEQQDERMTNVTDRYLAGKPGKYTFTRYGPDGEVISERKRTIRAPGEKGGKGGGGGGRGGGGSE